MFELLSALTVLTLGIPRQTERARDRNLMRTYAILTLLAAGLAVLNAVDWLEPLFERVHQALHALVRAGEGN